MVSHDRYFMDKVVDHLLVFQGQGDIRDFPGNYSRYREWKEERKQLERETSRPKEKETPAKQKTPQTQRRRMSFKERREYEQLEVEIATLEEEKSAIESALCSGTLTVEELTEKSKRLPLLTDELEAKTLRWFELGEIEE